MLFPIIVFVYLFLIYIGFYQYERCVAEQNLCYALLRSKEVGYLEQEGKLAFMNEAYDSVSKDGNFLVLLDNPEFEMKEGNVSGSISGRLATKLFYLGATERNTEWDMNVSKEYQVLSPVDFIRTCNKWKGVLEDGTGRGTE